MPKEHESEARMSDETAGAGASPVKPFDLDRRNVSGFDGSVSTKLDAKLYDPRPHEDQARRNIAYGLVALLYLICIGMFCTVWFTAVPINETIKIAQTLLPPIIVLVTAATGFYFGTKSKS